MSQVLETQSEADAFDQPPASGNNNCLLYGCLGVVAAMLLLFVCGGWALYSFATGQLDKYTATEPVELPSVDYTPEQIADLEKRIDSFKQNLEAESAGDATAEAPELQELVLTADDINALLNQNEKLRNRVYIKIEDGKITGDASMPLDEFSGMLEGRYLNGSVTLKVSLEDDYLVVNVLDAEVKGEKVPAEVMQEISKENFAKDMNGDPDARKMIRQFKSIRVEDNKIIATLKDKEEREEATESTDGEPKEAEAIQESVPSDAEPLTEAAAEAS